jgi:hypothetical protein
VAAFFYRQPSVYMRDLEMLARWVAHRSEVRDQPPYALPAGVVSACCKQRFCREANRERRADFNSKPDLSSRLFSSPYGTVVQASARCSSRGMPAAEDAYKSSPITRTLFRHQIIVILKKNAIKEECLAVSAEATHRAFFCRSKRHTEIDRTGL